MKPISWIHLSRIELPKLVPFFVVVPISSEHGPRNLSRVSKWGQVFHEWFWYLSENKRNKNLKWMQNLKPTCNKGTWILMQILWPSYFCNLILQITYELWSCYLEVPWNGRNWNIWEKYCKGEFIQTVGVFCKTCRKSFRQEGSLWNANFKFNKLSL